MTYLRRTGSSPTQPPVAARKDHSQILGELIGQVDIDLAHHGVVAPAPSIHAAPPLALGRALGQGKDHT
jgi:hypothetical protein